MEVHLDEMECLSYPLDKEVPMHADHDMAQGFTQRNAKRKYSNDIFEECVTCKLENNGKELQEHLGEKSISHDSETSVDEVFILGNSLKIEGVTSAGIEVDTTNKEEKTASSEFIDDYAMLGMLAQEIDYEGLKKDACKRLEFLILLHSYSPLKHDQSPTEIFMQLESDDKITIPNEQALCLIERRIQSLQTVHELEKYADFLKDLVDYHPHIEMDDDINETYERLKTNDQLHGLPEYLVRRGLDFLLWLLLRMVNPYDPRIRKGHRDELLRVIDRTCKIERRELMKYWVEHHMVDQNIDEQILELRSTEKYKCAKKMLFLHRKFESHLASSEFIKFDSTVPELLKDKRLIQGEYSSLPPQLIEESIEFRLFIVKKQHEYHRYSEFLRYFVGRRLAKECIEEEAEFLEAVERDGTFSDLPKHYIIRGFLGVTSVNYWQSIYEENDDIMDAALYEWELLRVTILQMWERTRYYECLHVYELPYVETPGEDLSNYDLVDPGQSDGPCGAVRHYILPHIRKMY